MKFACARATHYCAGLANSEETPVTQKPGAAAYTVNATGGSAGVFVGEVKCEPGYFCANGDRTACGTPTHYCPAGTGNQFGKPVTQTPGHALHA